MFLLHIDQINAALLSMRYFIFDIKTNLHSLSIRRESVKQEAEDTHVSAVQHQLLRGEF